MSDYRPRVLDDELDELLGPLPAIAIEGAKGVGKTATAQRRAGTVLRLDDPAQRELVRADMHRALSGTPPVLLDEWQREPAVWDVVRRAVDDRTPPGPFLLTGSAAPDLIGGPALHSGAGRIDIVRMRPMALGERLDLTPTVRLRDLLSGNGAEITGASPMTLAAYTDEILASGFPDIRDLQARPRRLRLDAYVARIVDRDFPDQLGIPVRRPQTLRRWLRAYAAATATTTTLEKIRTAAGTGDTAPAKSTVIAYRDALERLFVLDPIEGWLPTRNHLKRLTQAPKHHLVDPALAAVLLGASTDTLLRGEATVPAIPRDGTLLGALFESLVALSLRVYAQAAEATVRHLRTANGRHEIDFIVEDRSGGVVAIEVKLAASVNEADVRHLAWLKSELGEDLRDRVVITTGTHAYRRSDGVAVIPLALLGP